MTGRSDYPEDMDELDLDDARAEALLRGEARGDDWQLVRVAAFVRDLRATGAAPAPAPSPALAAVLRDGLRPQVPVQPARRRSSLAGWRRWVAVAGIGTSVAMTSVVGAGAAGFLPGPAERVVGDVVETLTPLELPKRVTEGGRTASPAPPRTPTTRGQASAPTTTLAPTTTAPPTTVARPTTSAPPTSRPAVSSGPGVTTSTVTVAPGPSSDGVPTTSTTVPGLPTLPLPNLPDLLPTLPGLHLPPITVPRLPW